MLAVVKSVALLGMEGHLVQVEVDVTNGLPGFDIVGLPDVSVRESRERVRSAIRNSGYDFPLKRITVNLAPADLRKEGPVFDLPIAIALLAASDQIVLEHNWLEMVYLGELALDGQIRGVTGVLPSAVVASRAGIRGMAVPGANAREGALVEGLEILAPSSLQQLCRAISGELELLAERVDVGALLSQGILGVGDFAEVKGHHLAKRALEVAAAGGHNVLLLGPPGAGKTMLARRLAGILPSMRLEEALEVSKVYSIAGLLPEDSPLITIRPFRSPHHNATRASMVGGGKLARPGEITLANNGVLFLDELPEYDRSVLEALRQPLEDQQITISRLYGSLTFPAKIILVASMNPCYCGYFGDPVRECTCSPNLVQRYLQKISGPLLDRIDLQLEIPRPHFSELEYGETSICARQEDDSKTIRARVEQCRKIQWERLKPCGLSCNAQMGVREVKEYCRLSSEAASLLKNAFTRLGLSARVLERLKKVSRTIADMAGEELIQTSHVAEALQYRNVDRKYWT